ncbi:unnamed protein product [Paramecium sonneborni]|uniref:Uncharacterized protein n=1 Tax=Paramecium sonneborni TaxID=65129 RepID=A0A8S1RUJ3_9CILI|nr:unnamed protein product [Paramecium sonneborni]
MQSNLKPFTYQLIKQYSIKQYEYCNAIAVNKDFSLMVAGCNQQIKVFQFKQGIFKQVSILDEHTDNVYTLNFMKRSDQFISGSRDSSIIIWIRNQKNSWICQQKLNEHISEIFCLALNNYEDLIVSGGHDKTIKFWYKQNGWLCSQTITDHTNDLHGLSFNEQQNKLISCGIDNLILVIEQSQQNKLWIVIQKIVVENFGNRLCFIDDNTFTFQPYQKEYMHVYKMNITNKQYTKTKDILIKGGSEKWLFPQQYMKLKCILVNKYATNVNLIRKKQNCDFIIEQSIEFGTGDILGCMTDDGQYLITLDYRSKEYQIRKYQEQ